jgi:hypothetical protein
LKGSNLETWMTADSSKLQFSLAKRRAEMQRLLSFAANLPIHVSHDAGLK